MAKNSIRDYSATNSSNTDIQSIDISEGCSPAGINNAIREVMADLKDVSTGAVALESPAFDSASLTGDLSFGDNDKILLGNSDDLQLYHDAGNSRIVDAGTGNLNLQADNNINILNNAGTEFKAQFITNGAVNLFYDNSKKLETTATGVDVTGGLNTTGNVGIGTNSPARDLHINGTAASAKAFVRFTHDGLASTGLDVGYSSGGFASIYNAENTAMAFSTNATERLRIDAAGNVTIQPAGTTTRSFGETVAVKKDQSAPTRLSVRNDTNDSNSAAGVTVSAAGNSWTVECGSAVKNGNALTFALDATAATPSEKMRITSGGFLRCVGVYNQSAADSANVVVDSTGNIYRSTSALKYKQDIRDIEEIDISQFRPIRYKSNLSRDDQTKDHFGFIADEAHDAGYTELVSYGAVNEETGIAEVEGFRYDRMTVLLTKVVQQQQETITALEARIAALEAN
jgi:hypothetical protein